MQLRPTSLVASMMLAVSPAYAAGVAPDAMTPDQPQVRPAPSSYRIISQEMAANIQPVFAPGGPPLPVYLNRWGGTYTQGWDNSATNTSSIVQGASATITPFPGSDGQWNDVLTCVQDQFAAFNVYVTDQEPTSGNYIEAVVAGSPDQLGMPWGVGGVAPYDPYNCQVIDRAVVYAFADVYLQGGWGGGVRSLCETTTQEIAHAMTLDHVLICEDPMTYLSGCGEKWFQDEYGTCGENEPRDCSCQRPSQNSVQLLTEILGPSDGSTPPPPVEDNTSPVVELLSPNNGDTFAAGTEIEIVAEITDDTALTLVQLYWENNDLFLSCPGQGGGWSCSQSGDRYTWRVAPGLGSRTFSVLGRDVVGNTTVSDDVTIYLTETGEPLPEDMALPDVAIVAPLAGAELQANSQIQVVVSASDDVGISQVWLEWDYSDEAFPCPMQTQTVSCTVEGSTFTWTLPVGGGERIFRAGARDLVGNEVVTIDRFITLVDSPQAEPEDDSYENNDTWDLATQIQCGDTLDLIAVGGDDDWFRLTVPEAEGVRVSISGEVAGGLEVSVRSGPFSGSSLASGDGDKVVEIVPEVEEIGVLVSASSSTYGAYALQVECVAADELLPEVNGSDEADDVDTPVDNEGPISMLGGCSAGHPASGHTVTGALALIGLGCVLRRRRR